MEFTCPEPGCGRKFKKPQALGAHRARKHGYRAGDDVKETAEHVLDRAIIEDVVEEWHKRAPLEAVAETNGDVALDDALLALVFPSGMPAKTEVIQKAQHMVGEARELHELTA